MQLAHPQHRTSVCRLQDPLETAPLSRLPACTKRASGYPSAKRSASLKHLYAVLTTSGNSQVNDQIEALWLHVVEATLGHVRGCTLIQNPMGYQRYADYYRAM